MRRSIISDLMPWRKPPYTDLGLARKYGASVADVKRLRVRVRQQIRWQTGNGPPPPADFKPVRIRRP